MESESNLTEVVLRARGGEQVAWDALVARFTPLLWSVARSYRLETAAAADVVQTTWMRLVEHLDRIHEPAALPGWLATTARREALRSLRHSGREVPDGQDWREPVDEAQTLRLESAVLEQERDAVLWRTFRGLAERCQRLLRILMAPDCPPYADVAVLLDMPIGSIGPTRARCLDKLRDLLGTSGYDFEGVGERGAR